jgi:small subunit ribosomal protein S9
MIRLFQRSQIRGFFQQSTSPHLSTPSIDFHPSSSWSRSYLPSHSKITAFYHSSPWILSFRLFSSRNSQDPKDSKKSKNDLKMPRKGRLEPTEEQVNWAFSQRENFEDPARRSEKTGLEPQRFPRNFEPKLGTPVSDEAKKARMETELPEPTNVNMFDMPFQDYVRIVDDPERERIEGGLPKPRKQRLVNGIPLGHGGRKTANATALLFPVADGSGEVTVNEMNIADYFKQQYYRSMVLEPLFVTETVGQFNIKCRVRGGGVHGQADACKNAIADALQQHDPLYRRTLKIGGYLTRDNRQVERKKTGRKKARKRFQWAKR